MSTGIVPPGVAAENPKLYEYVTLPGFPGIRVAAVAVGDLCSFHYEDGPEDPAASGVMLASRATPRGRHPGDAAGGKVSVSRPWRLAGQDQPRRYGGRGAPQRIRRAAALA
jgi:hypothetical protein